MKSILSFALLLTSSAWASLLEERDEVCEMVWVTVYTDAMPYSAMSAPSAIATGGPGQNATYANIMTSSTQSVSQGNTNTQSASIPSGSSSSSSPGTNGMISTNDVGEVGFPLDGPHLSAPVNDAAVPADVRIYPADSKTISGKALADWMGNQTKTPPPSKWLKIPAGVYSIDCKDTIYFSFMQGLNEGWTMDMRGVTFLVNGICQAIYINQCEDFTIYGGTLWFDGGEMWTQSQITSIDDIGGGYSTVTCVVEKGYNTTTWRDVTPRNLYVMDASDSNHYVRPTGLNFWFASDWNFDKLDSERTWTMKVLTSRVPLKATYTLTMQTGIAMGNTIGSENNGNLRIDGFTSNGGLSQIGLNTKKTATFENIYYVNPPARPAADFAPRVEGPTLSWGHVQWFDYDTPGQAKINYEYCWWMTTGCEKDLQDAADQNLHDGGY